jgi:hypothetical protein
LPDLVTHGLMSSIACQALAWIGKREEGLPDIAKSGLFVVRQELGPDLYKQVWGWGCLLDLAEARLDVI